MDNPLISVIVITYNSQSTIIETLESISTQTYNNIEIVVSDDCSTDNTVEVVNNWISESNIKLPIKIIKSDYNTGIAANCNRGIRAAGGKFVKIIAGDDYLSDCAVEVYYREQIKADRKTILQSRVVFFNKDVEITDEFESAVVRNQKCLSFPRKKQYKELLKANFIFAPAVGLLDKTIFEEVGYFDERFPMFEDLPFYVNLSKRGFVFRLMPEKLVYYRVSYGVSAQGGSKAYKKSTRKYFIKVRIKYQLACGMFFTAAKGVIKCLLRK